jgi:DnaJ family protein A protein 5
MTTQKQCHYSILDIAQNSTNDEIRTAYRKMALKWHPDKNQDRIEEATNKFKLISEAYKTLSNPQERAWYDAHREDILRGGDGTNDTNKDISWAQPDILPFFFQTSNASSTSNNNDTKQNFYFVTNQCFATIYDAEVRDADRRRVNFEHSSLPSSFGDASTPHDEVRIFYLRWSSFVSKMSFAWHDEHDIRGLESRDQRRYVEAENKKLREAASQEYTSSVRAFVEHVKHRDPRIVEMKRLAEEEKRTRSERDRIRKMEEQSQRAATSAMKRAYNNAYLDELERQELQREVVVLDDFEEDGNVVPHRNVGTDDDMMQDSSNGDDDNNIKYCCDLCQKTFRSNKQLDNHENSKKHKDMVKKHLKQTGQYSSRNKQDTLDVVGTTTTTTTITSTTTSTTEINEQIAKEEEILFDDTEIKYIPRTREDEEEEAELERLLNAHNISNATTTTTSNKDKMNDNNIDTLVNDLNTWADQLTAPDFTINTNNHKILIPDNHVQDKDDDDNEEEEEEDDDYQPTIMKSLVAVAIPSKDNNNNNIAGKKISGKQKREERRKKKEEKSEKKDGEFKCEVCDEIFTSRTKLFNHIKEEDHASPKDVIAGNNNNPIKSSSSNNKGKKKGDRS